MTESQSGTARAAGLRAIALLALALALAASLPLAGAAEAAKPRFADGELRVDRKRAFDLGVVDFDGDHRLDLFTTNHMFRDSLLRGTAAGFRDVYESAGFAPNPELPGIEDLGRKPSITEPGAYLFASTSKRRPTLRLANR